MKLKSYKNPPQKKWPQIIAAPHKQPVPSSRMADIVAAVEKDGDPALRRIVKETKDCVPRSWVVDKRNVAKFQKGITEEAKARLKALKTALTEVHRDQLPDPVLVRTSAGIEFCRQAVPVRTISICLDPDPATAATSLMMIAVPAQVAGCESINACIAPGPDGTFSPELMYTASICGIDKIYCVDGEAAVAAMSVGTATIKKADKLFVADARIAAALPARIAEKVQCVALSPLPSSILVMADDAADAASVASALADCAAHCKDTNLVLVCASARYALRVERAIDKLMQRSPLSAGVLATLSNTRMVIFEGEDFRFNALDFANMYAPDQLLLLVQDPAVLAEGVYAARVVQCGDGIDMSQRMQCGINALAHAVAPPDVAGTIGMPDLMHNIDFITKSPPTA